MKKLALVVALSGVLGACSTTSNDVQASLDQQKVVYQHQTEMTNQAIDQAPDWMTHLPKSATAVYANASAVSTDFSMEDLKAETIAYGKICTSAGGHIRSQTKIYQADTASGSVENSEFAAKSYCSDVDISGVETVAIKHVAEGNRIRTYVLIALPIGGANVIKSTHDAEARAPKALQELDNLPKDTADIPAPVVKTLPAEPTLAPAKPLVNIAPQNSSI